MSHSNVSIIIGFFSFLNPLQKGFSRKEVVVYCSRRQGPTGLWEKLPWFHYHLFNRGKEYLLKTDVELQDGKIDPSKKAVVLITDDTRGSVYGASFGDLVEQLKTEFNVVGIYLHENPRYIRHWKDVVTVGPLERGDLGAVVAEEIKSIQNLSEVEAVVALSLEGGDVLPNVWELGLPLLHYIPEFLSTSRQIERLKKSSRDSTILLFPNQETKAKAVSLIGGDNNLHTRVMESLSSLGFTSELKQLSKEATGFLEKEKKQSSEIKASGLLDPQYAYPKIEVLDQRPYRDYLVAWRSGWKPRKPCPGFHPGVYRNHNSDLEGDPTIDFIHKGKPAGAWLTEVIEGMGKSDSDREWGVRKPQTARVALHLHLHYTDGAEDLLQSIKTSTSQPDLFISTTSEEGKVKVQGTLSKYGLQAQEIAVFPNRGRDIAPFLTGFGPRLFSDYEIVGHLHSKKSPHAHDDYLENWVEFLEKGLVGEKGGMMDAILTKMTGDPSVGIVYPDDPGCFGWEGNHIYGKQLLEKMGYHAPNQKASMNFPVGTMFWTRTAAMKPLIDLNLTWEDYPEEPVPIDGSMLHALERVFGILPGLAGFRTVVTYVPGLTR